MVVYTCVCSKFETNHKNKYERHLSTKKHIDTSIVKDDRYKALEEKYKTLEETYKALEDKYKALEISPILDEDNADNKVEDISEDKVYNVSDMLSKTQYQTPSLGELKLDFHCDDYERNPIDGMIQVLNRIPFKPFQYVNGRWFSKQHNVWSYDKERTFMHHIRHQMMKETGSIFEEHIGDKDLHSEKWLEWILNSFKQLDSSDIKQILRSIR
jgi:hypothetical protein